MVKRERASKEHIARIITLFRARRLGWLDGRSWQEIADRLDVDRSTISRNIHALDGIEELVEQNLDRLSPQIKTKSPP